MDYIPSERSERRVLDDELPYNITTKFLEN